MFFDNDFNDGRYAVVEKCDMDMFDPMDPDKEYVSLYIDINNNGGFMADSASTEEQ